MDEQQHLRVLRRTSSGVEQWSPDHAYVADCWTHRVGPTGVLLVRHLHQRLGPEAGIELTYKEVGERLGVGFRGGVRSPLLRAMERLDRFGLAHFSADLHVLAVPDRVASLRAGQLIRAPEGVRASHEGHTAALERPRVPVRAAELQAVGR